MLVVACLIWFLLPSFSLALLEEQIVTFSPQDGAASIHDAAIVFAAEDPVGIKIAVSSLAGDFEQITGTRPTSFAIDADNATSQDPFGDQAPKTAIIAATLNSTLMQTLANSGHVNVTDIQGKWETFKTSVAASPMPGVENALIVAGSDKRAVIFGIYTLAQQCGQSPFHWWADVPATKHNEIYALPVNTTHGEPTIKYRGLFINDEAPALTGWWSKKHGVNHYPLDTEFYRNVFDLLLRLRANYMWPAMWASWVPRPGNIFFTDDPNNQQLANDYGIVLSTSHHEPMQRATNEWNETETGVWDWTKNKENVTQFMEEGVRRTGMNESFFCMGMRGPGDAPIEADDPVAVLKDVFATERDILANYYGSETAANQVWTIYKEVATYYAAGLIPPEDVTLMFTDDNWGNIQRLPTANETARAGGMYFHLEYVGDPKSYKWQNTSNLAKVLKDLYHAFQRGADRIWVINVADIKPMELPFGFIMDLAWDSSKIDFGNIPDYLKAFASREFGPEQAGEIASILLEHSRLIGRRKFEMTTPDTYSYYNYHESERVLDSWRQLTDRVTTVGNALPAESQTAFFHLVRYPVHAGYIYHAVILGQGTNWHYAVQRRNAANDVAHQVLADFDTDYDLIEEYNTIVDGKWDGIMSQPKYDMTLEPDFRAPSRDVAQNLTFVQLRQNLDYEFGNLGIYAEGSDSAALQGRISAALQGRICAASDFSNPTDDIWAPYLPTMDPYGPSTRSVEIFHRGDYRVPTTWQLDVPQAWITVTPNSGNVSRDLLQQRLDVSIDWASVPIDFDDTVDIDVRFDTQPFFDQLHIPVRNTKAPNDFHGFPETAGMISIEASHFQRSSDGAVAFESIPNLGTRTNSGAIALRSYQAARESVDTAQAASVEYDIYLFDDSVNMEATIYITAGLDTDPDLLMTYSLSLDSAPANFTRVLADPETTGDLPPDWYDTVADSVWRRTVLFGGVVKGTHTLKWSVNSPEVYLEKIVVDTQDAVGGSYLGPPETTMV